MSKTAKRYCWARTIVLGTPTPPEAAAPFAQTVLGLRKRLGHEPTVHDVVDAARPKSSTIHGLVFKKTDHEAAERYRVELCRNLLRDIRVVEEDEEGEEVIRPLIIAIAPEVERDESGTALAYERVEIARLTEPAIRERAARNMLNAAEDLIERFQELEDDQRLKPIFKGVAEAIERFAD